MTSAVQPEHPLAAMITSAAAADYPAADGGWRRMRPWRPRLEAVVAFTGHAVLVLADPVPADRLTALGVDGYGGAHDPRVVAALAGPGGWVDSLDALLVADGTGPPDATTPLPATRRHAPAAWQSTASQSTAPEPPLVPRPDLSAHPRVAFAARLRDDLRVLGYPDPQRRDLVVLARGIGGLTELSVELEPGRRGTGAGSALVVDALRMVPGGRLVIAAVAPGNAASLRAFLSAGFRPVASVQLFRAQGSRGGSR